MLTSIKKYFDEKIKSIVIDKIIVTVTGYLISWIPGKGYKMLSGLIFAFLSALIVSIPPEFAPMLQPLLDAFHPYAGEAITGGMGVAIIGFLDKLIDRLKDAQAIDAKKAE